MIRRPRRAAHSTGVRETGTQGKREPNNDDHNDKACNHHYDAASGDHHYDGGSDDNHDDDHDPASDDDHDPASDDDHDHNPSLGDTGDGWGLYSPNRGTNGEATSTTPGVALSRKTPLPRGWDC